MKKTREKDLAVVPSNILSKYPSVEEEIYFYYGYMQPLRKKLMSNVTMYLLKNFKPKYFCCWLSKEKPFKLVFFNKNCEDNYVLWNFRETLAYLPIEYLTNLEEFIIVIPYFYHRAMDFMTFGSLAKFVKSKQVFLFSNAQLCEHLSISQ